MRDPKMLAFASDRTVRDFVSTIELTPPASDQPASDSMPSRAPDVRASSPLQAPFATIFGVGISAEPPSPPPLARPVLGADAQSLGVEAGVNQAYLVGSQLVSFNEKVTPARRAAAVNSCLLAQLRASKLHPDRSTPSAAAKWHAAYVNTLTNLGWALQSGVESRQAVEELGATMDKALLELAASLLGGGPAVALIGQVFSALAKLQEGDPFITLYNSRTVSQQALSFGASLASGDGSQFFLSVLECAAQVRSERRQVLFFKWDTGGASFDGRRYDLSLADKAYEGARTLIEAKLAEHVRSAVTQIEI